MRKYGYYVVYIAKKAGAPNVSITGGAVILLSFKIESDLGLRHVIEYLVKENKELSEVIVMNWKRIRIYEESVKSIETTSASST